jgi:hypothetical protein
VSPTVVHGIGADLEIDPISEGSETRVKPTQATSQEVTFRITPESSKSVEFRDVEAIAKPAGVSVWDHYPQQKVEELNAKTPLPHWTPMEAESEEMRAWRVKASKPLEGQKMYKFEGQWWEAWKEGMLAALEESGLKELVLKDLSPPPESHTGETTKWRMANTMIRRFLFSHLGKEQAALLVDCQSPRDMWRRLQFTYENDSQANWAALFKQWVNLKQKPSQKLEEYLQQQERYYIQLKAIGHVYDEEFRKMLLLSGLNERFAMESKLFMHMGRPFQVVVANLRQAASQMEIGGRPHRESGAPQANSARAAGKPAHPKGSGGESGGGAKSGKGFKCFNCGDHGHRPTECPISRIRKADGSYETLCYSCKKPGHRSSECPSK